MGPRSSQPGRRRPAWGSRAGNSSTLVSTRVIFNAREDAAGRPRDSVSRERIRNLAPRDPAVLGGILRIAGNVLTRRAVGYTADSKGIFAWDVGKAIHPPG